MLLPLLVALAAIVALALGWMLFEAQWVEYRRVEVPVARLPRALDGFAVLHLSDFHLGTLSWNGRTLAKAVDWAARHQVDLVAVTGDLVSRRRGERTLRRALARLRSRYGTYAILGNHDVDETRDPFSGGADLSGLRAEEAQLLEHASATFAADGVTVQVAGADPRRLRDPLGHLPDPRAGLRILLLHFPDGIWSLGPGDFDLILAGHLHGGQICIPTPRGKLRLEHVRAPFWEGLFALPVGMLHVSRGLGTSFVPFRLLSRPEATILTLRAPD
ncbi:MAG TPA: metallophosphoesterase [Gaiellaceae bacterium]|nr:metallophosphoesterase [Gaiellaceae bacterium]